MSDTESSKSVLFVCLGNICRSPIAEAVFKHVAKERGVLDEWVVDSAATGDWHVGRKPDRRAIQCMKDHKVEMDHRARLVTTDDFTTFQYIFGMDEANISDLHNLKPKKSTAQIELLGKYDPEGKTIIRDPYYDDGSQGFEDVYVQCLRCCKAFLDQVS
uniref:Low molecular weight phosphotyrosine protein phosphatase n=1 Tax=Amblyomma triste TaxID=251400 RepID=A0A023GHN6_AMBTT